MHRSTLVWLSWLIFMAGVWHIPQLIIFLVGCGFVTSLIGWKRYVLLGWLMGCAAIGVAYYDQFFVDPIYLDGAKFNDTVLVDRLPVLHEGSQRLVVVTKEQQHLQLDADLYPEYRYGDVINLRCTIRLPKQIEGFAYDKYLARFHIQALCDYPTTAFVATNQGNKIITSIYEFRNNLRKRVESLWHEPAASLLLGVLIGEQDTIPISIYTSFQRAGVVHILVVSGMHVLLLVQLLTSFTKWLPKFYQTLVIVLALTAFCVLTGFSATVIRATVMGSIPLLGRFIGRPHRIHLTLTWAAGVITLVNPYILVHDVGFQLSFLATLGLVYMTPFVKPFTKWLPEKFELRDTVTTTLAATTTTAPWIGYTFGTWSNVAMLSNIVVLPTSNLMLFAGGVITALSVLFPNLAQMLATLLEVIINLLVQYVDWCAALPYAYIKW